MCASVCKETCVFMNIFMDDTHSLTPTHTQVICLSQLKEYLLRESNKGIAGGDNSSEATLMVLKWLMIHVDQVGFQYAPGVLDLRTMACMSSHARLFALIRHTTRTKQQAAAQTSQPMRALPAPAPSCPPASTVAAVDKAPQAPCATTPQAPPPPTKTRDAGGGAALRAVTAVTTGSEARRRGEFDGKGGPVVGSADEEGFYCAVCDCVVDSMRSVFNGFQRLRPCLLLMLCRALAPARICCARSHPSSTMLEPLSRQGVL